MRSMEAEEGKLKTFWHGTPRKPVISVITYFH